MANVSSSNTTTLYSTTQETVIQPGAAVATGQVNDANFTTLYTSGQQVNPNANLVVDGTLTVNGCAILTNCTSFNLLPTTATSINFGLEATALSIGSGSGTTTINNQLATANYTFPVADGLAGQVLVTNGAGVLSFATASSVGKDYDISASSTTGGANFNLNSNLPTTDTIKFANGSNITVVATNANTITISATDTNTTYTIDASATTGGANFNLVGSDLTTDTIKFSGSGATTVTQTNANEINISSVNTNTTYDFNASSTTGGVNLNLVGSDSTTDTVKLSNGTGVTVSYVSGTEASIAIGQDVATTASPTFAGGTFGNITIAVLDDNTITTTTGDLRLTALANTNTVRLISTAASPVIAARGTTNTNSPARALTLLADSTGTPAVGFGTTLDYEVESAPSVFKRAGYIEVTATDLTSSSEDFQMAFGLMENGAVYNRKLKIDSTADILITGSQTSAIPVGIGGQIATDDFWHIGGYAVGGVSNAGALEIAVANNGTEPIYVRQYSSGFTSGNAWPWNNTILRTLTLLDSNGDTTLPGSLTLTGSTSGSTTFSQPATGSVLTYVLPSSQGAASTVLTNDGFGNLTWALPGGGGSTFGNVTVGVVTDNTISTTTGDLILDSATNQVLITADVGVGGNLTANDLYARSNVYLNIDQTPSQPAQLIAYSGVTGTSVSNITWNGTAWTAANEFNVNGSSTLASYLQLSGSSSGYSRFTAPATGANIVYTLPNAQGAASTVLTNDGSGNLSWALPGGGGSQFGNITVGVVTDNTISTTTGDLILDAASNIVQVDADQLYLPLNTTINMEDNYLIDSASLTTSTTAANQVLANMSASVTRSAKFVVQITSGTAYQIVEILGIHDGTTGTITVYGDVRTGANLASFDADVSGGFFRLLTTPVNSVTTYKVAITRMSV